MGCGGGLDHALPAPAFSRRGLARALFQAELDEKVGEAEAALGDAAAAGDAATALAAAAAAAPPAALAAAAAALRRAIHERVLPAQRTVADRREAMDVVEASGANSVPEVQRALGRLQGAKTLLRAARVAAGVVLPWQVEQDLRPPPADDAGAAAAAGPALGDIAMPLAPPIICAATGRVLLHAGMVAAAAPPRAVSCERAGRSVSVEAFGQLARTVRGAESLVRAAEASGDAAATEAAAAALAAVRRLDPDLVDGGM